MKARAVVIGGSKTVHRCSNLVIKNCGFYSCHTHNLLPAIMMVDLWYYSCFSGNSFPECCVYDFWRKKVSLRALIKIISEACTHSLINFCIIC